MRKKVSLVLLALLASTLIMGLFNFVPGASCAPTPLSSFPWNSNPWYENSTTLTTASTPYYQPSFSDYGDAFAVNLTAFGKTGYDYMYKETYTMKSSDPGVTFPDLVGSRMSSGDQAGAGNELYLYGTGGAYYVRLAFYGELYTIGNLWTPANTNYSVVYIFGINSTTHYKYANVTLYDYGFSEDPAHVYGSIDGNMYSANFGFGAPGSTMKFGLTCTGGGGTTIYDYKLYQYGGRDFTMNIGLSDGQGAAENIDGGHAPYVFVDWKYYLFNVSVACPLPDYAASEVYFKMLLPTTAGMCQSIVFYNVSANTWNLDLNITDPDHLLDAITIKSGEYALTATGFYVTFPIWFNARCLDVYNGTAAVPVYFKVIDTALLTSWITYDLNCFRVYSKGGYVAHTYTDGNAGPLAGGSNVLSQEAYNSSTFASEIWYRNLQHIKLLPTLSALTTQAWELTGYMDFSIGTGQFIQGLEFKMRAHTVSYTGLFAGNVWTNFTCTWYYHAAQIREDYVYMFYHGSVAGQGDPYNLQFWIDMWFDKGNASALMAGRVNAYEFPMKDDADLWLRWLANNWGVKDDVRKESASSHELTDGSGALIDISQIKMVRLKLESTVVPWTTEQHLVVDPFNVYDTTLGKYPLEGINTPPFDETKVPTVGQTGLLGALWSGLNALGKWIGDNILFGGLALWPMLVGFLDTIAGWLGAPQGFTNLLNWILTGWGWLVTSFTYAFSIIAGIFTFLGATIGAFIWAIGQAIVSFANVFIMIGNFLSGASGGAGDLWNQLGLANWFTLALIFYPLYLVILWDTKGMGAVMEQLGWIWGMLHWLATFFISVIQAIIQAINTVIEAVPVVE